MKGIKSNRIHIEEGKKLRHAWAVRGNAVCAHDHFGIESTRLGYATGFYVCKGCGVRKRYADVPLKRNVNDNRMPGVRLTAAFLSGSLIGAVIALVYAHERVGDRRRRFSRAFRNFRTEVPLLITDSRGPYRALVKDARQTFRQTACRLRGIIRTCLNTVKKRSMGP